MSVRVLAAAVLAVALAPPAASALPPGYRTETLHRLEFPAGLAFTPRGDRLFITERVGRIRVVVNGRLVAQPFASVRTITSAERGLLGVAVDPRWDDGEMWVYAFYTLPDGSANVVDRFRWDADRSSRRERLMTLPSAPGYHNGGVLAFGPDQKLYIAHGESHSSERAQDPRLTGGKIYRINPDGSVPSDNPFEGSPTWAYGIRNSYGIAFSPAGMLYETENGPSDHDEVNLIRKGGNYGWPAVQGRTGDDRFIDPIVDYTRIVVPTGIAVLSEPFPAAVHGDLVVGTYLAQKLRHISLSADGTRVERDEVWSSGESIVALALGRDGLYYATPDAVKRIVPPDAKTPTATATATASPGAPPTQDSGGMVPLVVLGVALGAGLAITLALLYRRGRG